MVRKRILTAVIIGATACVAERGLCQVEEITNRYHEACAALCDIVSQSLTNEIATRPNGILHKSIKLAGFLRCADMRDVLIDNLGYTPWRADGFEVAGLHTNFCFFAGVTGERCRITGRYPALNALLNIGVQFSNFVNNAPKYVGYEAPEAESLIGMKAGGDYYFKFARKKYGEEYTFFPITKLKPPRMMAHDIEYAIQPFKMVFDNRERDFAGEYNELQENLCVQLKNGLTSNDNGIANVISAMGYIRSLDAIPVLADNLTICPQASTNAPNGFVFPAVEALISIGPAIGDCFERLKATTPLSVEEALWLRISHELYPEGLEYELYCAAATNDTRAARLLQSLPWRRLSDEDCEPVELRQEMIEGKKQTEMKGDD